MNARIQPLGDSALIVDLPAGRVHDACAWLDSPTLPGVREVVPGSMTVTVFYCPLAVVEAGAPMADPAGWLEARVRERLETLPAAGRGAEARRLVEIPVCYEDDFAPDLRQLSERLDMPVERIISLHTEAEFSVAQLGFAPGFPYLRGLPDALAVPRLTTPRTRVPAGSVGIANQHSCVYPIAIPGGWNLIGRTPLKLFRPEAMPPVLLGPGDRVRFRAITAAAFGEWEGGA